MPNGRSYLKNVKPQFPAASSSPKKDTKKPKKKKDKADAVRMMGYMARRGMG